MTVENLIRLLKEVDEDLIVWVKWGEGKDMAKGVEVFIDFDSEIKLMIV